MFISAAPSTVQSDPVNPRFRGVKFSDARGPVLRPQILPGPPSYRRSAPLMKLDGIGNLPWPFGSMQDAQAAAAQPTKQFTPTTVSTKAGSMATVTPQMKAAMTADTRPPFTGDAVTANLTTPSGTLPPQSGSPFTLPENFTYDVAPQLPPWFVPGLLGLAAVLFFTQSKNA